MEMQLFSPAQLGPLELGNRMVMAPLTRCRALGNVPNAALANPNLPERRRNGAALNEADPDTFYTAGPEGYTDYPTLTT